MRDGNSHVFIEVKRRHLGPVNALRLDQMLQHFKLRCARGHDNVGAPALLDGLADEFGAQLRGGGSGDVLVAADDNLWLAFFHKICVMKGWRTLGGM